MDNNTKKNRLIGIVGSHHCVSRLYSCLVFSSLFMLLGLCLSLTDLASIQTSNTRQNYSDTVTAFDSSVDNPVFEVHEISRESEEETESEIDWVLEFAATDIDICCSFLSEHFHDSLCINTSEYLQNRKSIVLQV